MLRLQYFCCHVAASDNIGKYRIWNFLKTKWNAFFHSILIFQFYFHFHVFYPIHQMWHIFRLTNIQWLVGFNVLINSIIYLEDIHHWFAQRTNDQFSSISLSLQIFSQKTKQKSDSFHLFYLYHKKIQSVNIHSRTFCRHTSFTRSRKMIISCIRKEGASRAFPFNKNIQNWDSKMHLTSTTLIWLLSGTRFGFIFNFRQA